MTEYFRCEMCVKQCKFYIAKMTYGDAIDTIKKEKPCEEDTYLISSNVRLRDDSDETEW